MDLAGRPILSAAQLFPLAALLCIGIAIADETFKLNRPDVELPVGTTLDESIEMKLTRIPLEFDVAGNRKFAKGSLSMLINAQSAVRVLGPKKYAVVIRRAENKLLVDLGARSLRKDIETPLIDKKIIVERDDGKYKAKLHEGEPDEKMKEFLALLVKSMKQEEDNAAYIYAKRDYKVKDRVSYNMRSPLYGFFGLEDAGGSTIARMRIERIEERGGVRCAVIKGTVGLRGKITPNEVRTGGDSVINGKITIWRSIDYGMDMRVELDGTYDFVWGIMQNLGVARGKGPISVVIDRKFRK